MKKLKGFAWCLDTSVLAPSFSPKIAEYLNFLAGFFVCSGGYSAAQHKYMFSIFCNTWDELAVIHRLNWLGTCCRPPKRRNQVGEQSERNANFETCALDQSSGWLRTNIVWSSVTIGAMWKAPLLRSGPIMQGEPHL